MDLVYVCPAVAGYCEVLMRLFSTSQLDLERPRPCWNVGFCGISCIPSATYEVVRCVHRMPQHLDGTSPLCPTGALQGLRLAGWLVSYIWEHLLARVAHTCICSKQLPAQSSHLMVQSNVSVAVV
jgi:hypothetical protein